MFLGLGPPQVDHRGQPLRLVGRRGRGTPSGRPRRGTAPTGRRRTATPGRWRVTAFQPSAQMPRWPTISKYCTGFALGASGAAAKLDSIDVPVTGICSYAAVHGGRRDAERLVDRGRRCRSRGGTGGASPVAPSRRAGPVHDARHVDAALVRVLLVPLERRVARLRPAPRVVAVAVRAADVVEAVDRLVGRLDDEVEELPFVQDAERAALLATRRCPRAARSSCCRARRAPRARRRGGRSARRCGRGTRRTPPAGARRASALVLRELVPGLDAGVARREVACRRGPGRAPSASRTTRRAIASHPASNFPRYFSRYSAGAWCGACVAPNARYRKNGLSGRIDLVSEISLIDWSTRSSDRWYPSATVRGGSTKWLSATSSGWNWSVSPSRKP